MFALCFYWVTEMWPRGRGGGKNHGGGIFDKYLIPLLRGRGIPPWALFSCEMHEIKTALRELPEKMVEKLEEVLERKGVAAGNCTKAMLDEAMKQACQQSFQNFMRWHSAQTPVAVAETQPRRRNHTRGNQIMFNWNSDAKYHRMPGGYILSARATATRPAVKLTPRDAYFRWHLPDVEGWTQPNGDVVTLPALKYTDCHDYSKNQLKRWSDWGIVAKHFDKLLLEHAGIQVPQLPTGEDVSNQFDQALQLHLREVRDWHPSMSKRRKRQNGDIANKLSTILTDIRKVKKSKKEWKKKLNEVNTDLKHRYWMRKFVIHIRLVLFEAYDISTRSK